MEMRSIYEELEITKFKKNLEREIEDYFENKGFSLVEPRVFQNYDDFILSNFRQDPSKTVKVLGGDSNIFILRTDITTNILKRVFSKWDGKNPLKVYYNSKIYQNKPGGKIGEKYQMGVENLGGIPLKGDKEIIEMAGSVMETLVEPYILELGSSKYIDGFFKELDLKFSDEMKIRNLISQKNRDGLKLKLESLNIKNTILDFILDMEGDMKQVISIARLHKMNKEMKKALDSLEELNKSLIEKDIIKNIKFDLSMMPDLDYYDGVIFKGYCFSTPNKIISGGRYDRLTEKFGMRIPAIGFMIDMDLFTRIRIKEGK